MIRAIPIKGISEERERELKHYVRTNLDRAIRGTQMLFTEHVPRWRKIYNGEPFEQVKSFPWHRASNFVVQLVGIHTDTLVARILSLIFKTDPLFTFTAFGELPEHVKKDLEDFMKHVSLDETELALYNVIKDWLFDIVKLGSSVVKIPYVTDKTIVVEPSSTPNEISEREMVRYDGPKPMKTLFTDFLMWPLGVQDFKDAIMKVHRVRLHKETALLRAYQGFYDLEVIKQLYNRPDLSNRTSVEVKQEENTGITSLPADRLTFYECWIDKYPLVDGRYYSLVLTYHLESDSFVRKIYNPYNTGDELSDVFIGCKLFPRDDMWHGRGFAELLEQSQEEASTIHNQRRDAATAANTNIIVARKDSMLDLSFPLFPNKPLFVDSLDDIRVERMGQPSTFEFEEERIALDLAERRSGVSPPMIGYGAGAMGGKRGVYSASGTLSMLQEGNMRTDLNIMDLRAAVTRTGRLALKSYALGGVHERLRQKFDSKRMIRIMRSIAMYNQLQMDLTCSNASVNREVDRQQATMLAQTMTAYYKESIELVKMIMMIKDPVLQNYLKSIYNGSKVLFHNILKSFDNGDTERILPRLEIPGTDVPAGADSQGVPGQQGNVVPFAQQPGVEPVSPTIGASGEQVPPNVGTLPSSA